MGLLDDWIRFREMSFEEAKTALAAEPKHIKENVNYGKLTGLTCLHNSAISPGELFYDGDEFILFYINKVDDYTRTQLIEELGEPDFTLRSRAGKRFIHHIYSLYGIAFAAEKAKEAVKLLEIMPPPITLESYQAKYYIQPDSFKR
jgi:hypothetical protein